MPGAVDVHFHCRAPSRPERGDFASETAAAAAGGVTTVFEMPISDPACSTPDVFLTRRALIQTEAHVNVALYAGAAVEPARAEAMAALGAIGFKLFTLAPAPGTRARVRRALGHRRRGYLPRALERRGDRAALRHPSRERLAARPPPGTAGRGRTASPGRRGDRHRHHRGDRERGLGADPHRARLFAHGARRRPRRARARRRPDRGDMPAVPPPRPPHRRAVRRPGQDRAAAPDARRPRRALGGARGRDDRRRRQRPLALPAAREARRRFRGRAAGPAHGRAPRARDPRRGRAGRPSRSSARSASSRPPRRGSSASRRRGRSTSAPTRT